MFIFRSPRIGCMRFSEGRCGTQLFEETNNNSAYDQIYRHVRYTQSEVEKRQALNHAVTVDELRQSLQKISLELNNIKSKKQPPIVKLKSTFICSPVCSGLVIGKCLNSPCPKGFAHTFADHVTADQKAIHQIRANPYFASV